MEGATEESAAAGVRWVEVIRGPGEELDFRAEWLVTLAAPGHTWVIETENLHMTGVRCQIVYTFVDHPDGTYFRRDMSSLVDDAAELDETMAANLGDSSVHDLYLRTVKAALER